jgi:DNA-binding MarR family transcriptional regulator
MNVSTHRVAGQVLEIIPLVTRRVTADLRKSGGVKRLAYVGLLGIVAREPRSLTDLSDFQAVSLPTMSKTITTIENLGWVVRKRSETDRRVVMVEATPAGRAALKEVHTLAIEPIAEALDALTPTERQKLSGGLRILREVFAEAPGEQENESG